MDTIATIRRLMPHVLVLVVLGCGIALLLTVFVKLLQPMLLAACIALVSGPFLFDPLLKVAGKVPGFIASLAAPNGGNRCHGDHCCSWQSYHFLLLVFGSKNFAGLYEHAIGLLRNDGDALAAVENCHRRSQRNS